MAEIRAAEVRDSDGYIANVVMLDSTAEVAALRGHTFVDDPNGEAEIGRTYDFIAMTFSPKPVAPDPRSLAEVKSGAKQEVDAAAGRERARYITAVEGQPEVYARKEAELLAWEAATSPRILADYSWMQRRAARLNRIAVDRLNLVTEPQMQAVATDWRAKIMLWEPIGLDIEDTREQGKEDIDAAADVDAVRAVLAALTWPAPA